MTKAIVLLSGGLDSLLAAKLLKDQGIKVQGLTFVTPFFNPSASLGAGSLGIPLRVVDISEEHFKLLKDPPHGYGKNVNPCIDCHGLMLKKAKEMMSRAAGFRYAGKKEGYDFVATGEVLGQRPMSQNKQSLAVVEKLAGLEGYLLRPLSAQLLKETIPEQRGLVNRSKLLGLSGKQRKAQMALAKKWKIKEYATPSGGCLLTDPGYAERFKKLQKAFPYFNLHEVELLKYGRLFIDPASSDAGRGSDYLFIVGRNQKDDLAIKKIAAKDDVLLEIKDIPGPITLLHFFRVTRAPVPERIKKTALEKAAGKTVRYGNKRVREKDEIMVLVGDKEEMVVKTKKLFL